MSVQLPNYLLSLKSTKSVEDVPALMLNTNSNAVETAKYVNSIKKVLEELIANPTSGLNLEQVREQIALSRISRTIDGSKHTSAGTFSYDDYSVTYSVDSDGNHTYVLSHPFNTENSFVSVKDSDGRVEYPNIQTTGTNIVLKMRSKINISETKTVLIF